MQLNDRLEEALKSSASGDNLALVKVADEISDSLHAAVIMLKVMFIISSTSLSSKKRDENIDLISFKTLMFTILAKYIYYKHK